jgi:tetrahydromethanopterin S-methyltransferase subunit B
MTIKEILADREKTHGSFDDVAVIAQAIKEIIHKSCDHLYEDQVEALDMIATKMARILRGNQTYVDSWLDIEGYARLVRERIEKDDTAD